MLPVLMFVAACAGETTEPELELAPTTSVAASSADFRGPSGRTHHRAPFPRGSAGESVAVEAVFSATGGTIDQDGLYTAGPTAGTFRVVVTSQGLADTSVVTLAASSAGATSMPKPMAASAVPPAGMGIPFGPSGVEDGSPAAQPFSMTVQGVTPDNIVSRLNAARAAKAKLMLNMTGGKHGKYMTAGSFDYTKWTAALSAYNTGEIRRAIAERVTDGTIVGYSVMDEPHVHGGGDGNTWGPAGTMTKARVDQMCGYAKAMFPTLPVGVAHRHSAFEPKKSYRVCEFIISQYSSRHGSVTDFRDEALAIARRDGHQVIFGMNILNGGIQDRDGNWDCARTGGKGTYRPNCRMTPAQIRENGLVLGPAGCALSMWRYEADFMADAENRRAFEEVAEQLARLPAKPCRRQ